MKKNQWYYAVIRIKCKEVELHKKPGEFQITFECQTSPPIRSNKLKPHVTSYKSIYLKPKIILLDHIIAKFTNKHTKETRQDRQEQVDWVCYTIQTSIIFLIVQYIQIRFPKAYIIIDRYNNSTYNELPESTLVEDI